MATVCVLACDDTPLMPTTNLKKVRKLLRSGKAIIAGHKPVFTIKLTYETTKDTQPIEYACDTGYQHVGVSIKSEKHEYISGQFDMLSGETERHNDCSKYRRTRRNRLRYRKPRFNNRAKKKGWIAPSLQNKADIQYRLFENFKKIMPITSATFEMGQFDTQVLTAVESGLPIPAGVEYQHGPTYGYDTLREAVFQRDGFTCKVCEKSAIADGAILRVHHLGFRIGDRSNRMNNLLTVCTKCHTAANHKPGGKLYDLKPKLSSFKGAAFMNTIKWYLYNKLQADFPMVDFHITYGAVTKRKRLTRNLSKSHANDAYCIGNYHPKHRSETQIWQKKRRNNRVLEYFYDAVYFDMVSKEYKKGAELSSDRTNRSEPRNGFESKRPKRGPKKSKGRRTIRRQRYSIRPGDKVYVDNQWFVVSGLQHYGKYAAIKGCKAVKVDSIKKVIHIGAWQQIK